MREKIKVRYPVITEGKYDKIRLNEILETTVITTDGFRIFNKKEKRAIEGDDDGYYVVNDIFPELAKKYGKKKINEYMRNFNYGSIDFQDEWCLEDFEHRLEVREK